MISLAENRAKLGDRLEMGAIRTLLILLGALPLVAGVSLIFSAGTVPQFAGCVLLAGAGGWLIWAAFRVEMRFPAGELSVKCGNLVIVDEAQLRGPQEIPATALRSIVVCPDVRTLPELRELSPEDLLRRTQMLGQTTEPPNLGLFFAMPTRLDHGRARFFTGDGRLKNRAITAVLMRVSDPDAAVRELSLEPAMKTLVMRVN